MACAAKLLQKAAYRRMSQPAILSDCMDGLALGHAVDAGVGIVLGADMLTERSLGMFGDADDLTTCEADQCGPDLRRKGFPEGHVRIYPRPCGLSWTVPSSMFS